MGIYICLEGVKGSGKTTLFSAITAALDRQGIDWAAVSPTRATRGRSLPEFVAACIPALRQVDLFNEYLYACRSNHAARRADWGKALLLGDRSVITSYVTRWHKYPDPERCIQRVNRLETAIHRPDHVIYLQIDLQVALNRIFSRHGRTYGHHDETGRRLVENMEAYNAIRLGSHPIARLAGICWHVIDAGQSREAVFRQCWQMIRRIAPQVFQHDTIVSAEQING